LKPNPVKRALKAGEPQVGTWLSLGSVFAARFLARTGMPWLTVDMEHTHTDIQTAALMFGAIADGGSVPLARVPTGRHDYIKMVLDCGAMGIVAPMVMDADEARSIVAACKYPPLGNRSVGGGLHALNYGCTAENYFECADGEILVVIQAEHIRAVEIADEIYSVPGVDAVFVGPNDLARSMRQEGGAAPSKQELEDVLQRILAAAKRNKLPCGIHVQTPADALRRAKEGWQFIAVASELKMMLEGAKALVDAVYPERAKGELARY
jgi:4-hydroxy-2-oxoheptanedioate aldolase